MKSRSALQFVLIIGIVNFFADFTYEGARGIVGPFLGSLGASAAIVGFVAGFGELLGTACARSRVISRTNRIGIGHLPLWDTQSTCSRFPRLRLPDNGRLPLALLWPNALDEAFANRQWKLCFRTLANQLAQGGYLD